MGWIDAADDLAAAPRIAHPEVVLEAKDLDIDRGYGEATDVRIASARIDVSECDHVAVNGSILDGVVLLDDAATAEVTLWRSHLSACDLSAVRSTSVRSTTFVACKFVGTDWADARLTDVVFERCTLRHVNLRGAALERVRFLDCTIVDADLGATTLVDVTVPGTHITHTALERVRATRVDLRDAAVLELTAVGRLDGVVVTEVQLAGLAHTLAFSAGLGVERPPGHERTA